MEKDLQGAFAVSGYIVALVGLGVGTLQAHINQSYTFLRRTREHVVSISWFWTCYAVCIHDSDLLEVTRL